MRYAFQLHPHNYRKCSCVNTDNPQFIKNCRLCNVELELIELLQEWILRYGQHLSMNTRTSFELITGHWAGAGLYPSLKHFWLVCACRTSHSNSNSWLPGRYHLKTIQRHTYTTACGCGCVCARQHWTRQATAAETAANKSCHPTISWQAPVSISVRLMFGLCNSTTQNFRSSTGRRLTNQ